MNLKYLSTIVTTSLLSLSPLTIDSANADEFKKGFYSSYSLGTGTYSDLILSGTIFALPFDYGFSYEAGVGYDFGERFRTELSYTNTTSSISTGHQAKFGSFMLNGYVDFPIENSKWAPFVGAGIGTTNVDATNLCTAGGTDDCKDNVGTFAISGGVNYALNDTTEITTKVSYLGFGDVDVTDDGTLIRITGSETLSYRVGLTFKF